MSKLTGKVLTLPKMMGSVGAKTISIGGNGENGATFIPAVSVDGVISWTNDKYLPNPEPVNIKGVKGADGVSATHEWDGTVLTITSASGSSSADLIGPQGPRGLTGATGKDGSPGVDGITPELSIGTVTTLSAGSNATATITGTKEKPLLNLGIPKGRDGEGTGSGESGADGEDGGYYVPSVDANGNLNWTATKNDMPSVPATNIKGAQGSKGDTGDAGYSPVRGKDYWTPADIAEIQSYVDEAILGGEW